MPFLFEPLRWVRWLGLGVAVAAAVGRGLAPALRGMAPDGLVRVTEVAAALMSQGLLLSLEVALVLLTASMLRLPGLPVLYRMGVTALGGVVLGLSAPAGVTRLAPVFSQALAVVASLAALAGAAQALGSRASRALGFLLSFAALGGLTQQAAWWVELGAGSRGPARLAGQWVAGGALLMQALVAVVALIWLATRRRGLMSFSTTLCSALAMVASWYAEHLQSGRLSYLGQVVARAVILPLSPLSPPAPLGVRVFLATEAGLLALLAVAGKREAPGMLGAVALVLLSGVDLDVPLCALSITVASLAGTLAAHDPETARHPIRHDLSDS